jgi:hypothetical protein
MSLDVNRPAVAGSTSYASSIFTVKAAGSGIASTADQFRFTYLMLTGDGNVTARVASLSSTYANAKAGVMMRESLLSNAPHAFLSLSPSGGIRFERRLLAGGSLAVAASASGTAPVWLRLVRKGSSYYAYRSSNGSTWTLMGSGTITMSSPLYVGLAVSSHVTSAATTASFTNVAVGTSTTTTVGTTTALGRVAFSPSVDHATLVTKYVFEVFAAGANPSTSAPLRTQDLGKPAIVNNEITASVSTTVQALAPGNYVAAVRAVGSSGSSCSTASGTFTR